MFHLGESPALECFLLGDVDGSFSNNIILIEFIKK